MNNMRLKKLSIVAVMSIMCLAVNAQEKSCSKVTHGNHRIKCPYFQFSLIHVNHIRY